MKKVLHIFNEIKFSGGEIMYLSASEMFNQWGWELLLVSTGKAKGSYAKQFEEKKMKVFHMPLPYKFAIFKTYNYYKKFYNFLKLNKIEALHIHRSDIYLMALFARILNIKIIKTQHNNFKNRKWTLPIAICKRYFYRKCLNVQFHSIGESVYNNELNYYKNPSKRINNWYNSDLFYPAIDEHEKKKLRAKLHIGENDFVIITVGGCSPIKRHSDVLKAINLLKNKAKIFYLHLGKGVSENEEIRLTKKFGLENEVRFLGNKTNVRDYLIASDVYVMPSKFEGLSIASIEAMACGLPSILYNSPGLVDLIKENDNGFLIKPDHKILAEHILFFYSDKKLRMLKGKSAQEFVSNEFSITKGVKKIIELYTNEI